MSYHDNLKRPLPEDREIVRRREEDGWSMPTLVIGGIAALAVIFGLMFMLGGSPSGPNTASNAERTAPVSTPTTTPAQPRATETTGSGAASTTVPPGTTSPPR